MPLTRRLNGMVPGCADHSSLFLRQRENSSRFSNAHDVRHMIRQV